MDEATTFAGRATFIVGPEKTATTFIQMLLDLHPDISLPQGIKETFFFEKFFENGVDWYFGRFSEGCATRHLVEVTPGCFGDETALERMRQTFPDAHIVICVRDPVERTISHYNHLRRYGYLNRPLAESLDPGERPVKASLYSKFCPRWEKAFGSGNVSVLDMNLLTHDPAEFAGRVFDAVGVRRIEVPQKVLNRRANEAAVPGNFLVARLATFVANEFKRHGFYKSLAFLRRTPIHGLVYGSAKPAGDKGAGADVRARLHVLLRDEYAFLEQRYGIHFDPAAKPRPHEAA